MTWTLDGVIDHAESLGLHVLWRDLGRRAGELKAGGLVVVNPKRTELTQRITIAHECGHHVHGHDWSRMHDRARDEREANRYAASLLISPVEYALAEHIYDSKPGAIARELGVTRQLLELWQQTQPTTRAIAG